MEVGVPEAVSLTLNEAGYVVGQSSTAINRAVDRGVIKAKLQRRGKHQLRKVGPAELRYLAIAGEVEKDLTPAARRKIYEAVRRLPAGVHRLDLGLMEFKLSDIDQRISERLSRLEQVKAFVHEPAGADPVLRGTSVPVHVVAALAKGQSLAEIGEDYPSLTPAQIDAAVEYAKVYPRTGRPLPPRSLKRMLADAAEAGAWDEDTVAEPVGPQLIP
jgi:uncharacterized protein (DUF433 family)